MLEESPNQTELNVSWASVVCLAERGMCKASGGWAGISKTNKPFLAMEEGFEAGS
jgi:hypothetical protein